jgi:hypothetical protein
MTFFSILIISLSFFDEIKNFLGLSRFYGWLFICRKSILITQNGYITAECGIVGFVARNLLCKTLYMTFQTRCQNHA